MTRGRKQRTVLYLDDVDSRDIAALADADEALTVHPVRTPKRAVESLHADAHNIDCLVVAHTHVRRWADDDTATDECERVESDSVGTADSPRPSDLNRSDDSAETTTRQFFETLRQFSLPLVLLSDADSETVARLTLDTGADDAFSRHRGEAESALLARRIRELSGLSDLSTRSEPTEGSEHSERSPSAQTGNIEQPSGRSKPASADAHDTAIDTDLAPVTARRDDHLWDEIPLITTTIDALDALDDVFYVFDFERRLVQWNQYLNEQFGLADEQLLGMSPSDFFIDADQPVVERAVRTVLRDGEVVVEAHADTVNGRILFELTGRLLTDEAGNPVGFCGVGRDVTTPRKQAVRLERQNERLEEFANIVAHDLRNPLSVAQGFLDIEREQQQQHSPHLDRVDTALARMSRIIDEVLTAAREGQAVETPSSSTLERIVEAAWDSVETDDASLSSDGVSNTRIEADAGRLQRLFENLFRNAVEHGVGTDHQRSEDGVDRVESVTISVGILGTERGFYVEDDGSGIPSADRKRVFSPGVSTSTTGTGFGLNIVRTLAEAHGWEVTLTAADSGGARFEFTDVQLDVEEAEAGD